MILQKYPAYKIITILKPFRRHYFKERFYCSNNKLSSFSNYTCFSSIL